MTAIPRFEYESPVEIGLLWGVADGVIYQEKFDGVRCLLEWGKLHGRNKSYKLPGPIPAELSETVLDGELVRGIFHVFDVLYADGRELTRLPMSERLDALARLSTHFAAWMRPVQSYADGGALLIDVLNRGGEGIVRKELHTTWAYGWEKCKRQATDDVVVLAVNSTNFEAGQYRDGKLVSVGKVQTRRDGFRVGQVVEVICHSRHASGMLREARPVRVRTDKPATECTFTTALGCNAAAPG